MVTPRRYLMWALCISPAWRYIFDEEIGTVIEVVKECRWLDRIYNQDGSFLSNWMIMVQYKCTIPMDYAMELYILVRQLQLTRPGMYISDNSHYSRATNAHIQFISTTNPLRSSPRRPNRR